jgi:hypothetical protein
MPSHEAYDAVGDGEREDECVERDGAGRLRMGRCFGYKPLYLGFA